MLFADGVYEDGMCVKIIHCKSYEKLIDIKVYFFYNNAYGKSVNVYKFNNDF
jgi:hypothetical protein